MKALMIALTAAATLSAAAPAFAAKYDKYADQQRDEQTYQYSGVSERCQMILNHTGRFGPNEVKECQNSIP